MILGNDLPFLVILVFSGRINGEEEIRFRHTKPIFAENVTISAKAGKIINLFDVVRFKNGPCSGNSRNGTCYTSTECSQKGGTSDGSCASGFGVCCTFTLGCGSTSSENCSYFVQSAVTEMGTVPCTFTVCKCHSNVCRIRLDFTTMVIADPVQSPGAAATANTAPFIGQCQTDTFTVTSPGNNAPPVICGFNTGQHMYLDASDSCHELNFNIGNSDSTTSRFWDIKITHYDCGSEKGGPPDCLQYFTGSTGSFASFGFQTDATTVSETETHLQNQCYAVCFRREANICKICFAPTINAADPRSFGISIASAAANNAEQNDNCATDYLGINGGQDAAATNAVTGGTSQKFCGAFLSNTQGTAGTTVCTLNAPYKVDVKFDGTELVGTDQTDSEVDVTPSGTTGFYLTFDQRTDCA